MAGEEVEGEVAATMEEAVEEEAVAEETMEEAAEETLEEAVAEEEATAEAAEETVEDAAVEEETLEAAVDGEAEETAADELMEGEVPAAEVLAAEEALLAGADVDEALVDEALAEEAPPEEEEIGEDELDLGEEGEDIAEHLKEAVEGSIHLKRMMEQMEENDAPSSKKPKTESEVLIDKLMTKWALKNDLVIKHCLQNVHPEALKEIDKTNYKPDMFHQRSYADLLKAHACQIMERRGIGGGPNDCLATFKFRWKLTLEQDKKLRTLSHKDLRYVLNNFDGTTPFEDVIAASVDHVPDEVCTETALPKSLGVATLGRFGRLELIDPLADSAVFGDANLTFAMRLAKHRKALGHVGRVIATTFEDLKTLRERYKEIDDSIAFLEGYFAEVYHSVDCTRIAVDQRFAGMESSLGAVYYNFPHSGAVAGFFDGHPLVNWRHENLMRLFFRALRSFVKPGGSVKVSSNMSAVGVRYSYIVESALENEFVHVETMPFLEWHLHRYGRSYGDRRDAYKRPDAKNNESYNAQSKGGDMVYCFCYAPTGEPVGKPNVRLPPSIKTLMSSNERPFQGMVGAAKENLAKSLYQRFLTEISGTHVG